MTGSSRICDEGVIWRSWPDVIDILVASGWFVSIVFCMESVFERACLLFVCLYVEGWLEWDGKLDVAAY
jgi:hypothetical protein